MDTELENVMDILFNNNDLAFNCPIDVSIFTVNEE